MPIDFAERARALVGTRFRPQGRGPEGLDCVGLVLATYAIPSAEVRRDYRIRGNHRAETTRALGRYFRSIPKASVRPGDVMLLSVAADQLHLAVRTALGMVHAHAGLGRVVETPGAPEWPLLGVYRRRIRKRSN
jgi:hypothetical protein